MKTVVCNIEEFPLDTNTRALTFGKAYKLINEVTINSRYSIYYIINDFGEEARYNSLLFTNLEEWREGQLNKLL